MTNSGDDGRGGFGGFPDDPGRQAANVVDDNPLLRLERSAQSPRRGPQRSPAANTAAMLGFLSLFLWCLGPFGIVAGVLALEEIKRGRGKLHGGGSALFGLFGGVIGTVALLTVLVVYVVWKPSLETMVEGWFNGDATPTLEKATPTAVDPQKALSLGQLEAIDPVEASFSVHGRSQGMPVVQIYGNIPEGSGLDLVLKCAGAMGSMQARALVHNSSAEFGPLLHDGARLSDGECTGWVRLDPEQQPPLVARKFGTRGSKLMGSNVRVEGGVRVWQIPIDFRVGDGTESAAERTERGTLASHYRTFGELRDTLRKRLRSIEKAGIAGDDERWIVFSAHWNDQRLEDIESFQQVFGYRENEYGGTQPRAWMAVRSLPQLLYYEWEAYDAELSGLPLSTDSEKAKAKTDLGFKKAKEALHLE